MTLNRFLLQFYVLLSYPINWLFINWVYIPYVVYPSVDDGKLSRNDYIVLIIMWLLSPFMFLVELILVIVFNCGDVLEAFGRFLFG